MINFVEMSKQEINICIWELMNGKEDNDTWECLKRLKKPASFMTSLYKKTCKINSMEPDVNIIDKFKTHLDGLLQVKKEIMKPEKEDNNTFVHEEPGIKVATTVDKEDSTKIIVEASFKPSELVHHENNNAPKMISRKRKE
jgi:hypothetical protein